MLYLACLPCGDSIECNPKMEKTISAENNHQEHQHESESCTPFCTCSCCAVPAFFVAYSKAQIDKPTFQSRKYPLYNIALNADVYYSIWQPPKLS